ncbi:hypothetical protein AAC387_Pa07g1806 [Persea americana]
MKTRPLSLSTPITHISKATFLHLIPFQFATSATERSFSDSDAWEEGGEGDPSPIIQDHDLLRKSNNSPTSLNVLNLIDRGSIEPDPEIYNRLLKRATQMKKLKEGRIIHAHFLGSKFKSDLFILNTIINMYAKCGSLSDAQKAFDEMRLKDMVTWTALITGYAQNDRAEEAIALFPQMLRQGLKPNQFTFASLLKAYGAAQSNERGRQVHAFCVKYGCDLNVYVGSSLLDMYARYGDMKEANLVFDGLSCKNEVSCNALIAGYARKGEGEEAFKQFWKMQRAGSIEDARKVFDRLDKSDVVSWNSMLTGCAQHGRGKEAIQRFEEMLRIGIEPNEITFLCVLTACSHNGLLNEGQFYFELMKRYNVEPKVEHYVTIVDLLGRAGLLDQAQRYINDMPIEPTAAVWGALLGACRMHRNMELGAYAAERVFELDPHDSGPHVLLSNIYASAGRWSDAARVRKMMKDSGVKKEPACSWVEIENSVHMFVANDDSHPQREEIQKMWEKISAKIKEVGYVPDTNYVLLFVDQQEREAKLQYHSEKLALAFALLKTPPGATIRIKKNIRMCGDCHSAIKFVSMVMEREIVVRDTNRFHHFSNGFCSCGDYW